MTGIAATEDVVVARSARTILKPCSVPGCGKLSAEARCPEHVHQRNVERGKAGGGRVYGDTHQRLRVECFERDGWKCQGILPDGKACGWEPLIVSAMREAGREAPPAFKILEYLRLARARGERHLHADHIQTIQQRPDLKDSLGNLQALCDSCHSRKSQCERRPD